MPNHVSAARFLERPKSVYHDWSRRAEETLRDLDKSPEATIQAYAHRYLHPYTDAEYPDSMVQLTALLPIREYWGGAEGPRLTIRSHTRPKAGCRNIGVAAE